MSGSSNGVSEEPGGSIELTESERHRLLASEQRRAVLDILADQTPPIGLEALVAAIAARENGVHASSDELAASLHHAHLPKLDDYGVIDYDADSNCVESIRVQIDFVVA